jgi:hypothetical protein
MKHCAEHAASISLRRDLVKFVPCSVVLSKCSSRLIIRSKGVGKEEDGRRAAEVGAGEGVAPRFRG